MRTKLIPAFAAIALSLQTAASEPADSLTLGEVVVTGSRDAVNPRHLSQTVTVVGRRTIEADMQQSLLPTLTEHVPGLFTTSRGVMGYGVSDGSAGAISLRGLNGSSGRMMVLIDGHPQYAGIFGHPISDAYQSMLADKVEVVRGPASVIYGSNAMGGVVNIVTRRNRTSGVETQLHAGAGSYGTVETELTNTVNAGQFSSTIAASYNRTDGHRRNMGFEQYGGYAKAAYRFSDRWDIFADVYLNNVLYKTIDNPAPDTDVVVPLNTVDGANSVTVYCFNGVGRGFPATVSVFTGKDSPAAPANFRATVGDEGVVLTWDTPLGAHGGTLDTEGFGYVLGCYINGELSFLTNSLGAVNRFVDTAKRDNQTSVMYAIAAFNETGDGPTALSNSVVTGGKPYTLPFFETFPSGFSTYGVWENQSVNRGLSGWRIWNPETDTFKPFDDDQGALVFQAAKEGDECRLFSGNIDMRSSRHPVLSFRYRGVNSSQKLTVEASANSAEWQPVGEIVLDPADNEWHTAKISLNRFNETELFQIALHATAVDLSPIVVDCIEIRDVFTDDLGIAFSSRHNFYPGEPQTLTATVTNLGENNADAWSVDFLRDGEVIATADGQTLVPDQTAKLTTSVTVGLGDNDEAVYSARVNYNADRNPDNNLSDGIGVRHHLPLFPAPTDLSLTGKIDEGYSFAWNEPAPWTAPAPETVTDDFENYEPFIIDEIGDWTVVDENGAEGTFGLIGLHFPYREAAKSFQIFNLWALGIEMGDDEVTWRPHSGHQMLVAFADKDCHNDDWLISPVLSGDAQTISFWARSLNTFSYGPETYEVLASTTGNSLKDFSVIESGEVPGDWTEFKIDLPAGTTYFAIKCTSDDVWAMAVDDITYTPGTGMPANPQLTGYNLYRNNEPAGTAVTGNTAATLAGNATDSFAVTAVYAEGESRFSNIIVPGQTGLGSVSAGHKVTVSTRGLDIVIAGLGGRTANLYSADGRLYASATAADRTTLTVGAPGVYIVAVDTDVVKIVVR